MNRLAATSVVIVVCAFALAAQPTPSPVGTTLTRDIASGQSHEYTVRAAAGELLFGPIDVRGVAAQIEVRDAAGAVLRTWYFMEPARPQQRQVGFVAPTTADYRISIAAYDAFDSGTQSAPRLPAPITGALRGSYTLRLDRSTVEDRMRGDGAVPRRARTSPRLQRLSRDAERGTGQPIEQFWREVQGKGPLVEPYPQDPRDVLVTFLWRETYEVRNVLLVWAISNQKADDYYMSRLPATDVWFITLRLRAGTRFTYRLSPNDRADLRPLTSELDPLHTRVFPDDPSYPFQRDSVLETPGAPDERWARRTPARRGAIEQKQFRSTLLKNDREMWVYTPPGYTAAAGPYPFVLLFDGAAYVTPRFLNAPATLDNLIEERRIRPAIVAFVPSINRGVEQGFGTAGAYGEAIVRELVPMLRAAYPITTDPRQMIAAGFSNGGMAAAVLALRHSGVFGNVLAQSGSFRAAEPISEEPNTIARMFLTERQLPIRFYLETGLYDANPAAAAVLHQAALDEPNLAGNRHFRDVLLAKGYEVIYREIGGTHENLHWRAMLADGLMALLRPEGS